MIRFKNFLCILALLFSYSAVAQDNGKGCALDVSQSKFETSGCTRTDGVTIWKLIPRDQKRYAGNLDGLPTFILVGDDLGVILKLMGSGETPYNNFIKLPTPDAILSTTAIPVEAKEVMEKINWRLTNTVLSIYEGAGENEGPGVVCGTYDRKGSSGYFVVLQCIDFQEKNRDALKDLLDLVWAQLR
ncbi:hypothetical protein ACCD10_29475 [Pseudomonas sp. Pseusp122]|uniref:hypothetical protein n=1 Tax=unclassified Pseudomonas TaxID=196821 RepID=UPI0039A665F4